MTQTLYSLRTDPNGYRITKFVDGEVESSYLTSHDACECPAGHRPSCRHRQMLPQMLAHGIADTHWFMDWDRSGSIVDFQGASKRLYDQLAAATGADQPNSILDDIPYIEAVGEALLVASAEDTTPPIEQDQLYLSLAATSEAVNEPTLHPAYKAKPNSAPQVQQQQASRSWRRL